MTFGHCILNEQIEALSFPNAEVNVCRLEPGIMFFTIMPFTTL